MCPLLQSEYALPLNTNRGNNKQTFHIEVRDVNLVRVYLYSTFDQLRWVKLYKYIFCCYTEVNKLTAHSLLLAYVCVWCTCCMSVCWGHRYLSPGLHLPSSAELVTSLWGNTCHQWEPVWRALTLTVLWGSRWQFPNESFLLAWGEKTWKRKKKKKSCQLSEAVNGDFVSLP